MCAVPIMAVFWNSLTLLLLLLLLLSYSGLAGFQRLRATGQALLIHYSAKNFRIIRRVLRVTALCMRI